LLFLFEDYALDTDRRELHHRSTLISIEPQVFDVLEYLIRNRDRVVSKDELLASVWRGRIVSDSTLASRINAARRAIGDDGERQRLIRTTIGRGLRFTATAIEGVAQAAVTTREMAEASERFETALVSPKSNKTQLPWNRIPGKVWRIAGRNWSIEARYVEYCSCDVVCPCISMGEPTSGHCTGLFAFKIDNGYCDAVRLDNLAVVVTFYFPRAVHHGEGLLQPIIDERANQDQRDALLYIVSGEDQPVGSVFQIFSAVAETGAPLFANIDFEWDLKKRRARVEIGDLVSACCEPARNPVTGEELRIVTLVPNGWMFREAENLSGFARGRGSIKFNLFRRHSALARIFWTQDGLV